MSDPILELQQIAATYVAPIRESLLGVYRRFLADVSENEISGVLKKEGYEVQKAAQSIDDILNILGGYISEDVVPKMTDTWMASGRKVTSALPKGALTGPFSFDTSRVSALTASGGYRAGFVQDVLESQREAISQVVNRGLVTGQPRIQVARNIRGVIGLTSKQEQWIENYRRQLTQMDPSVLNRLLRDRRSDRLLHRLIDSGSYLSDKQIDSMVERYRQRMVRWRAETIARTESLRAVRMGEYESLLAADAAGVLNPLLKRFWVVNADERLRRYHAPIPGLNPEGRGIDEPFQTPLGLMRYPLDPAGTASNVVNCRCYLVYRLPTAFGDYKNIPVRGSILPELSDIEY